MTPIHNPFTGSVDHGSYNAGVNRAILSLGSCMAVVRSLPYYSPSCRIYALDIIYLRVGPQGNQISVTLGPKVCKWKPCLGVWSPRVQV